MADKEDTHGPEILALINDLVEKKTFGLDAAPAIAELRKLAKKQAENIEWYETNQKAMEAKNSRQGFEISTLEKKLADWKAREAALVDREKTIAEVDMRAAVAAATLAGFREMAGMFLKNRLVREQVQSRVPIATTHQGSSSAMVMDYGKTDAIAREEE